DESIVTQFEMHSLEELGLLKVDLLGLKNLTIIEKTLEAIEKNYNQKIDINNISFQDQKTMQLFQRAETIGIFQLESEGMRKNLKELKPTSFDDIVSLIALYRPGPMEWIKEFIDRKHGRKKIEYLSEELKPILESTYGICIFQEQLMEIAQKMAGFSLGQADILRKAVGKKIKNLLLEQKQKLEEGMKKRGIKKEIAEKIWHWILPFASYGFNKSHSVAYAIIAFQTAYLKAHFPIEFMASLLNSETNDIEKIAFLINEAKRMKIEVLPPDINESFEYFSVVPQKKCIRFGLLAIKNVGLASAQIIIEEREKNGPFQTIEDFIFRIPPHYINKKTMESLIKVGTFDNLGERNFLLQNLETILEENKKFFREKNSKQIGLFDKNKMKPKLKLKSVPPASKKEKLIWEKELLGLFIVSQPFEELKKAIQKGTMMVSDFLFFGSTSRKVKLGGMISSIKKIFSKKGYPILFLNLHDFANKIEVIAFPSVFEKKPEIFQENKIVLVSGKIENHQGSPKLICEDIEEVIEI
ncbi:MAG: DNA polymerase III subunit alpha, partial [Minisyncoccales bacterium]